MPTKGKRPSRPHNDRLARLRNDNDLRRALLEGAGLLLFLLLCLAAIARHLAALVADARSALQGGYAQLSDARGAVAGAGAKKLRKALEGAWGPSAQPHCTLTHTATGSFFAFHHRTAATETFVSTLVCDAASAARQHRCAVYFEVEVESLHDQADLLIGFVEDGAAGPPGHAAGSVGFRPRTGEVLSGDRLQHTFDLAELVRAEYALDASTAHDVTGAFFGVGYSFDARAYFFSFNGRVLDSVSPPIAAELRIQLHQLKRDELIGRGKQLADLNLAKLRREFRLGKEQRAELQGRPEFRARPGGLRPALHVAGVARFAVNVGAARFQARDADLAGGVLPRAAGHRRSA